MQLASRAVRALAFVLIFLLPLFGFGQKSNLVCIRCNAIDRNSPVKNLFVAADGVKWVANGRGAFQLRACDLTTPLGLAPGEQSALGFRSGNADIRWTGEQLRKAGTPDFDISAVFFDAKNDHLWVGTRRSGLLRFKTKPELTFVEALTTKNSKLKSDEISNLFQDNAGRLWVGTAEGAMVGGPGKWKTELDGYDVQRIRQIGPDVWALADGEFWQVVGGEKFKAIDIDTKALEGEPRDFDIAPDGKLWILTAMVSRYDLTTGQFETFSGPQDYTSELGRHLAADADGAIWVGTQDKGVFLIDKSSAMTVNILIDKELTCSGNGKEAALRVVMSGGNPPFYYSWAGGLAGENPSGLAAGTYSLTVSDKSGQSRTAKAVVQDPNMTLSIRQTQQESAPGANNAAAEVTVKGGAPPYSFRWDNAESAATATRLAEGNHNVTVTDSKGCVATANVTVSQKEIAMDVKITVKTGIRCAGQAESALEVEVTGGKPPFKYAWNSPAVQGARPSNLAAGDYILTVTDAAGKTITGALSLKQPDALLLSTKADAPARPNSTDGKASARPAGGAGKYTYAWDNGETTVQAARLSPGKHTLTVTDANGCTASGNVEIVESLLAISADITEKTPVKCSGEKQAALAVNVSGGKAPFKYVWNLADANGEQPSNLAVGKYEVTVTDAAGQTARADFTVKQPDPVAASARADGPTTLGASDGKATAKGSGGSGNFTFRWSNGETSAQATRLPAGNHSVTVTDGNGCTASATVGITENILRLEAALSEKSAIKCSGEKSGALSVAVSGGKPPFQFRWNNPAANGENPGNLGPAVYTVTVTDAAGGQATASTTLRQPEPMTVSVKNDSPASTGNADGKATAKSSGGSGSTTFRWSNGETSAQALRLAPGNHTVTVTDANGCSAVGSVGISENILTLTVGILVKGNIRCAGEKQGALSADVSGGKKPYTFSWGTPGISGENPSGLAAGNYTLTVTDAIGTKASASGQIPQPDLLQSTVRTDAPASSGKSDGKATARGTGGSGQYSYRWENGETAAQAEKLAPGKHTVTVTDANGCTTTGSVDITENILPLAASISEKSGIRCAGEKTAAIEVEVSGGKKPFRFDWGIPGITGQNPGNLPGGVYNLTVTDAAGLKIEKTITIKEPQPLTVSVRADAPASTGNADGRATLTAAGGAGKNDYRWSNGETGLQATKLSPGKQTVTVTDVNGCSATGSVEIFENVQPLTVSILEKTAVKCSGKKEGALEVKVSGGKPPYNFAWKNPGVSGDAPSSLTADTYVVTVTDGKGATKTDEFTFKVPDGIQAEIIKNIGATTDKTKDGRASVKAKGGTGSLRYEWDNGETGTKGEGFSLGAHKVTVTDEKGCSVVLNFETAKRILPELNAQMLKAGQNVRMEQLQFDADSINLNESCLPVLEEVYQFLTENGGIVIEIGGHTNSTPPDAYCDKLSSGRSKAVAEHLISKGIDAKRVFHKGYGKRVPVAPNTTPEGRKKNQRVEIKILKIE